MPTIRPFKRYLLRGLLLLLVAIAVPTAYILAAGYRHADLRSLPPLESGDLVFETALTNQTTPILVATASLYSHVGILHKHPDGSYSVIHASRTVIESSLADFVRTGWGEQFTVKRYPGLSDAQRDAIVASAETYLGRSYNYVFYLKSSTIYCSELPYLAFAAAQVPVGTLQKIGNLHVNNSPVQALFAKRWHMHPACQGADMDAERCWKKVMQEPIITPAGVADDPHLVTVYSNYAF